MERSDAARDRAFVASHDARPNRPTCQCVSWEPSSVFWLFGDAFTQLVVFKRRHVQASQNTIDSPVRRQISDRLIGNTNRFLRDVR